MIHNLVARGRRPVTIAVAAFVVSGMLTVMSGQTVQKTKPPIKKPTTVKKSATMKKETSGSEKTDCLAPAVRTDSLRLALEKAAADSVQRRMESLAARRITDSLKSPRLRSIRNDAFGLGERLTFDVNYGPVTAGEAVMEIPALEVIAGRICYRVEFKVNSHSSFSWIYKVEDRYLTIIDTATIAPWRFEQHISEGNYHRDFVAGFDQVTHIAKTTEGDYAIPPYVHDIVSAFYYVRTIDFSTMKVGDQIVISNFYKDTSYELAVKVLGRQELEVAAGTFNTIVVEPLVKEGGLFKSEGRIVVWLTDDERKIPVRVNTKVIIGSIDTELREYSGIHGPVRSRIK